MQNVLPYVALVAIVAGMGNFFWFLFESMALGGDALNGYQIGPRYFLGGVGHPEVSRAVWEWSRLHATSLLITHPAALVSGGYLAFKFVFPSQIGVGIDAVSSADRLARVDASGPAVSTRCAGRIGKTSFSGPLLTVEVRPGGIQIKPLFMRPFVVLAAEIKTVGWKKRFMARGIEIVHNERDMRSPLLLYLSAESPVARAIKNLSGLGADHSAGPDLEPASPPTPLQKSRDHSGLPPGIWGGLTALGILVNIALIAFGVFWLIPEVGLFGWVWTASAIAILAINARRGFGLGP